MSKAPSRKALRPKEQSERKQTPCRSQRPGQGEVHEPPQEPEGRKRGEWLPGGGAAQSPDSPAWGDSPATRGQGKKDVKEILVTRGARPLARFPTSRSQSACMRRPRVSLASPRNGGQKQLCTTKSQESNQKNCWGNPQPRSSYMLVPRPRM